MHSVVYLITDDQLVVAASGERQRLFVGRFGGLLVLRLSDVLLA